MELEILSHRKNIQHHTQMQKLGGTPYNEEQDGRAYEDRIKSLLQDMEGLSKKHIHEVNLLHENYRPYVSKTRDLEERIKVFQSDFEAAQKSERALKTENTRLKLQLNLKIKKNTDQHERDRHADNNDPSPTKKRRNAKSM